MVELRLDSINDSGMPADCFVSVRIGDTQKLSRLAASRVYRFPKAGDRRYGKVEVFRRIGSCSVDVDPANSDFRELSICCGEAGFGTLDLKVAVEGEKKAEVASDPVEVQKEGTKVKAAKEYLSKHGLEVRLSEAMQAVLRERPADPAEFLAGKLMETRDRAGGIKLPPSKVGPQHDAGGMPGKTEEPQKAAAPMPRGLEPLQPQAAKPDAKVLPFKPYYAANFGRMGDDVFAKCYSKFPLKIPKPSPQAPKAIAAVAETPKAFFKPSVGTWLSRVPVKLAGSVAEAKPLFQLKPSVGTWLVPRPPVKKAQEAETKDVVSFKKKPSVGTWLAPRPRGPKEAAKKDDSSKTGGMTWVHKPSIGTWLAKAKPAQPAPAPQKTCFTKLPSVGTWLAKKPVRQPKPPSFAKRPSVGTWLCTLPGRMA